MQKLLANILHNLFFLFNFSYENNLKVNKNNTTVNNAVAKLLNVLPNIFFLKFNILLIKR